MKHRGVRFHADPKDGGFYAVVGGRRLTAITKGGIKKAIDCALDGPDHDGGRAFGEEAKK